MFAYLYLFLRAIWEVIKFLGKWVQILYEDGNETRKDNIYAILISDSGQGLYDVQIKRANSRVEIFYRFLIMENIQQET